jgi:hypothetical protein
VDLHAAARASNVRRDCRALLNNLPRKRVLFAFAEPASEDYLFRLINPGMAASGWPSAGSEPVVAAIAPCRRANRRRVNNDMVRLDVRITTLFFLQRIVSSCDRMNMHT